MFSILLAIIYISFISLGLPDSLLGSAWPIMGAELSVPLSYAGIVSMIISGGTILSSLLSDKMTRKLGAGLVTAISVAMTAIALLLFSLTDSFVLICLFAVPYGLGAGAVDAALNNYVALHYASRHMNWLHCFWGVGATLGPYIMGLSIGSSHGWQGGYFTVSMIQLALTLLLFLTLPLWKQKENGEAEYVEADIGLSGALKIKGVKAVLVAFFGYCAFETSAGVWASSYLVSGRGFDAESAAAFAALFYLGITLGRFISGFIADRLGDKNMIRVGIFVMLFGVALILIPFKSSIPALLGLCIMGLGGAPVYPSIIHATPINFGKENSHAIVGVQMASAYCGSTFIPPLFGIIAQNFTIKIYPIYLLAFIVLLVFMSERVNKACKRTV